MRNHIARAPSRAQRRHVPLRCIQGLCKRNEAFALFFRCRKQLVSLHDALPRRFRYRPHFTYSEYVLCSQYQMTVKTRREEYSDATRRALTESARKLFAKRGYAETSIEDIVARARVTRGAFYHHYESKQAVFEQVYAELHVDLMT